MKGILQLVCKYQNKERIIKVNNKFVPMNPREWNTEYNVTVNVGLGTGSKSEQLSVMQMVHEFEAQSGSQIMYKFSSRRLGDTAKVWADASKAKEKLGFQARLGAPEMCRDTWRWQSANPNGYK